MVKTRWSQAVPMQNKSLYGKSDHEISGMIDVNSIWLQNGNYNLWTDIEFKLSLKFDKKKKLCCPALQVQNNFHLSINHPVLTVVRCFVKFLAAPGFNGRDAYLSKVPRSESWANSDFLNGSIQLDCIDITKMIRWSKFVDKPASNLIGSTFDLPDFVPVRIELNSPSSLS